MKRRLSRKSIPVGIARRGGDGPPDDLVAVEEPLEIRFAGETVAVIMRSPGDDHRLALGYLFGERIIRSASDASTVFHCGRVGDEGYGNTIEVAPASGADVDWARLDGARRAGVTSSACGVCGRMTVTDLLEGLPPLPPGLVLPAERLVASIEALRRHQPTFEATGGTHAAALWDLDGELVAVHEDVGRHNAVDKVVGGLLLAVSGRGGFDIVQKAARAGIPVVACVSAPTSLAIAVARAAGITLAGFVRGERMNVYTGAERLTGLGPGG
jgi:FdhD protein